MEVVHMVPEVALNQLLPPPMVVMGLLHMVVHHLMVEQHQKPQPETHQHTVLHLLHLMVLHVQSLTKPLEELKGHTLVQEQQLMVDLGAKNQNQQRRQLLLVLDLQEDTVDTLLLSLLALLCQREDSAEKTALTVELDYPTDTRGEMTQTASSADILQSQELQLDLLEKRKKVPPQKNQFLQPEEFLGNCSTQVVGLDTLLSKREKRN